MTSGHKLRIGVLGAILAALLTSCSGGSNSDLEASLRAQLSETQTQLEQAQELIVKDPQLIWTGDIGATFAQISHAELYSRLFRS